MQFTCIGIVTPRVIVEVVVIENTAVGGIADIYIDKIAIIAHYTILLEVNHRSIVCSVEVEIAKTVYLIYCSLCDTVDNTCDYSLLATTSVRIAYQDVVLIEEDSVARD